MKNLIKEPIKTLFLGTDWESVETLDALNKDPRYSIVGVITTTDKPVGRKQILTPSKVKEYALGNGIEVFHSEKDDQKYKEAIQKFKPELVVCKAFGEIIPGFFLEYPKYKSINVHFSILPKYRGAVPIQKAILEGEKETGISIMLMAKGMDEGDILKIYKEKILPNDTNFSLRKRLVKKSAEVLGDVLEKWIKGNIQPRRQDNSKATYCWQKDISKENAQIQWEEMEPEYIERLVRAMIPWPIAWFIANQNTQKSIVNKRVLLLEAELLNQETNLPSGTIFIYNKKVLVSTKEKDKVIRMKKFQIEGKKKSNEKEFINGIGRSF